VRHGSKSGMYFRMLYRAAMLRKGQAISALVAILVAAAAATAMLTLYVDVQTKLQREFRNFGANLVVQARAPQAFLPQELQAIDAAVSNQGFAVPFAYAVARTQDDRAVVVAGTDFDLARKLNPWWSVSNWPHSQGDAVVGTRASRAVGKSGAPFTLTFQGHPISLAPAGIVSTGGGEDSRVYVSLPEFQAWTGLRPGTVEIAASGTPAEVNALLQKLQRGLSAADVHAVRQVTEGEANILGKTRATLLCSTAFIVVTAALCVLATLMGWVFDRRRDFAIMKALGASDLLIALFVTGEAAILACVGALGGFAAGVAIAALIGRVNFNAPVSPQFGIFPAVLAGCLAVTLVATLLPLRLLRGIQPAMILRGE
jgi:putative ABC transport system permease protein